MGVNDLDQHINSAEAACELARTGMLRVEIGACNIDQLARVAAMVRSQQSCLSAFAADVVRREEQLAAGGNERAVGKAVDPQGQQSPGEKKKAKARGEVLDAFPGMDDATRAGELTGDYADAIATATAKLTEPERAEFNRTNQNLADVAASMSLHRFKLHLQTRIEQVQRNAGLDLAARQRRNRSGSTWIDLDGMYQLVLSLHPELGARVHKAIEDRVEAMWREGRDDPTDTRTHRQLVADAVAELILAGADGTGTSSGRTELLVLIDLQTLVNGLHDESVHEMGDGNPLPVDTIRRIACGADIIPTVLSGDGVVLDHGRARRLATRPQRNALRAMYTHCALGDCDTAFDRCEIHHIHPWQPPFNGNTDLDNLIPVCKHGHDRIHHEHLTLTLHPTTRDLTVTHPDGTTETVLLNPRRQQPTEADEPGERSRGADRPDGQPDGSEQPPSADRSDSHPAEAERQAHTDKPDGHPPGTGEPGSQLTIFERPAHSDTPGDPLAGEPPPGHPVEPERPPNPAA